MTKQTSCPNQHGVNGRRYWELTWTDGGTTNERFIDFIEHVVSTLPHGDLGRRFCFTMDNLNSHKHPLVLNEILNRGHKCVFRAPYWAVDGAIEYVFNKMNTMLMIHYNELRTIGDLENKINQIFGIMPSFHPYFNHVGML